MPYSDPEKRRARQKAYEEEKRRKAGIAPRKPRRSDNERKEARRNEAKQRREFFPKRVREIRNKSMTKQRLAKRLVCSASEVPIELFEATLAILNVKRKIKELSK